MTPRELIVYACPTGDLATQMAHYFARSRAECGPNTAHAYMPHCTLTGFFHDLPASIPHYVQRLERALAAARPTQPTPVIAIERLRFDTQFHGFELSSPWLAQLVAAFATAADSPTRVDAIRLKDWLHLSLAYHFPPEQHDALMQIARGTIDPAAPVAWDLRFYERGPDNGWTCHACWPLA